MRKYLVAINHYRSSTSDGFDGAAEIFECVDRQQQADVLRLGVPVRDACFGDGAAVCSTMGVRLLTRSERRKLDPHYVRACPYYLDDDGNRTETP